jgi:hypothetical protein
MQPTEAQRVNHGACFGRFPFPALFVFFSALAILGAGPAEPVPGNRIWPWIAWPAPAGPLLFRPMNRAVTRTEGVERLLLNIEGGTWKICKETYKER